MKNMTTDSPFYIKAAITSVTGTTVGLAGINEILTTVAVLLSIGVSIIAIYKFIKNRKNHK